MAGIDANIIQEMVDQIDAFKKAIEASGEEARNKLEGLKIDEVLKEIPRTDEGTFDATAWSKLDENKQKELSDRIRLVREAIKGLLVTAIDAKSIQDLEDQIEIFKKIINRAGEEGRSRLKSIKIDDVLKEIPRKDGKIDATGWDALPEAKKQEIYDQLTFVRDALHAASEIDGPSEPKHIMYADYASNRAICIWTALGLVLTILLLIVIASKWDEATGHKKIGRPAAEDKREAGKTETLEKSKAGAKEEEKTKTQQEGQKTLGTQDQQGNVPKDGDKNKCAPTEGPVLIMVILLGSLGGTLHFVSSLVKFIGNRQLKRSWLAYYLAMPFTGAGLAPIVYMLLRVGLINPTGASTDGSAISSLNLIAIYAFAALTGMFSRAATDKLGEVFGTIFQTSKPPSKDELGSKKPPGDAAGGKSS